MCRAEIAVSCAAHHGEWRTVESPRFAPRTCETGPSTRAVGHVQRANDVHPASWTEPVTQQQEIVEKAVTV
jgi:hypothetical protein